MPVDASAQARRFGQSVTSSRSRRVWEGRFAALFALLTLLVWPASFWHEATTVHEVCAEHGELVDVAGADRASSTEHTGEPVLRQADSRDHEAGHEHCPFVALGQPSSSAPEARATGVRMLEQPAFLALPGAERWLSVPILSQAPKHSPPAIA